MRRTDPHSYALCTTGRPTVLYIVDAHGWRCLAHSWATPEDEVQLMLARISHVAHRRVLLYLLACLRAAFYSANAVYVWCIWKEARNGDLNFFSQAEEKIKRAWWEKQTKPKIIESSIIYIRSTIISYWAILSFKFLIFILIWTKYCKIMYTDQDK